MATIDSNKIIAKTIADYNLIAAKFSSTREKLTSDLLSLASKVSEKDRVLDYGCGNGRMSQLFAPDRYLGVDPSTELIKIARQKHPDYRFEVIEPLSMPDYIADSVLCLSVIHHIPDVNSQLELLRGLNSVLSQRGILYLTAWNLQDFPKQKDGLVHLPFKYEGGEVGRVLYSFTLEELNNLLLQSNFQVLDSRIAPRNRGVYSNLEVIAQKLT